MSTAASRTVTSDQTEATTVTANPFLAGYKAVNDGNELVSDGQAVIGIADREGRAVVCTAPRGNISQSTKTISVGTATNIFDAAGGGNFLDLTFLSISNSGGTKTLVTINDGTNNVLIINLEAGTTEVFNFTMCPWPQAAANLAWTATSSAGVATDLQLSALGIIRQ